jgi:hypothetical protein
MYAEWAVQIPVTPKKSYVDKNIFSVILAEALVNTEKITQIFF